MDRGTLLAGRYEVGERLGRGGMGEVWSARDRVLQRTIALKLLPLGEDAADDLVARFEREAVAAAQINHPNVVALYDRGVHEGTLFLTMELVDGAPLSTLIKTSGVLPPGRALARDSDAVLTKLLEAIASMFLRVQLQLEALLVEWDPRQAEMMLPDWERLLGLPDKCTATQALTVPDRQRLAYQRLLEQGGQSRAYFLGIAEQLGEPGCTITEFGLFDCNDDCNGALCSEADCFTWRVEIPHVAAPTRVMTCNDDCTTSLQLYTPNLIECPIRDRRPAHTNVIFSYTG